MPERRYGDKFSYWKPPDDAREDQTPLRKRILQESSIASQKYRRASQQRFFKAPSFPGASAFDLKSGENLPPAKRLQKSPATKLDDLDEDIEALENSDTWSDYVYHARVLAELEDIKAKSAATSSERGEVSSCSTFDDMTPEAPLLAGSATVPAGATSPPPTTKESVWQTPDADSVPMLPEVSAHELAGESQRIYSDLAAHFDTLQNALYSYQIQSEPIHAEVHMQAYFNLLTRHYDFFAATQHPSAPRALRTLAAKYAMPARLWQKTIKQTFDVLRAHAEQSETQLNMFATHTYQTMDNLTQNVPQMAHEWDLIKFNIERYFATLRADGIAIPSPKYSQSVNPHWYTAREIQFFGDDTFSENYFHAHLQPDLSSMWLDYWHNHIFETSLGTAHLIMSGWLAYGRKIATSFHTFCQTFFFLGLLC